MKKVFLFAAFIFIAVSFMGNYVSSNRVNYVPNSQCPYLNKMQQSSGTMICPYLKSLGKENTCEECPYLNGNSSSGECPYLKEHGNSAKTKDSYIPSIEMIGT